MREYSPHEVDALRAAVKNKFWWGRYGGPVGDATSRVSNERDSASVIEEQIRTHMFAGHTAENLTASDPVVSQEK
jgi:hypothetical protein